MISKGCAPVTKLLSLCTVLCFLDAAPGLCKLHCGFAGWHVCLAHAVDNESDNGGGLPSYYPFPLSLL